MFDRTNLDILADYEGKDSYEDLRSYTKWKRTGEIKSLIKDSGVNKLYSNDIAPDDIGQGGLGDCWFLSSLSVLARNPSRIRRLFGTQNAINEYGVYYVNMTINGEPI